MAKYPDLKSFVQANYLDLITNSIQKFVDKNLDSHGFHSINVYSLVPFEVQNPQVMTVKCEEAGLKDDEYVLQEAKRKKNREANAPEHETRHLKVYETSGYKYKPTPMIMLKGEWLRSWGFDTGAEVDVVCEGDD